MLGPRAKTGRISELLDALKTEVTNLTQEAAHYKLQCEELEHKMVSQMNEISQINYSLMELERRYYETQRKYEDLYRMQNLRGNDQINNFQRDKLFEPMQNDQINFPPLGKSDVTTTRAIMPPQTGNKRRLPDATGNNGSDSIPRLTIPNKLPKLEHNEDDDHNDNKLAKMNSIPSSFIPSSHMQQQPSNLPPPQLQQQQPPQPQHYQMSNSSNILPNIPPVSAAAFHPQKDHQMTPTQQPIQSQPIQQERLQPTQQPIQSQVQMPAPSQQTIQQAPQPIQSQPIQQQQPTLIQQQQQQQREQTPPTPLQQQQQSSTQQTPTPQGTQQIFPPIEESSPDCRLVRYSNTPESNIKLDLAYEFDHSSVVCCVRFSKDGKYLATGSNRKAQIFSVADGNQVAIFSGSNENSRDLYLRSVCFSPNGKLLACGAEDKTIKLWDVERKAMSHVFTGHSLDIYSIDYSHDGRLIVSGSGDKKVKLWEVEGKKCLYTLGSDEVGPKDGVTSVAFSPDGRYIAAGSLDRIIRLWDAHTGTFIDKFEGHSDSVYSVAFSPDGKSLASGSLDKTLKLWDLSEPHQQGRCRNVLSGHSDFVLSVAFSSDGNWLVSGSKDRSVMFWDPRTSVPQIKLEGHKNSVISVAVNPSCGTLATGSGDFKAKIWRFFSRQMY